MHFRDIRSASRYLGCCQRPPRWQQSWLLPPGPSRVLGRGHPGPTPKINRAFHERAALELLGRDGIAVIWRLHLDAAEAHRDGYQRGAQILIDTAEAAERLLRRAARERSRDVDA